MQTEKYATHFFVYNICLLKLIVHFFSFSLIHYIILLFFPVCGFMCFLNRKLNLEEIFLILYKIGQ